MAETWKARLLGEAGVTKPVLIKKVLPEYANDQAFTSMFVSEARISATLSHGNIAHVYDFGRADGEYFLAMEYVDGQPLHRINKRAPRAGLSAIPVPLATFIALEMCRGLHYAHTRKDDSGQPLGIVHRDISPDNVLISYEGQVKIVDFGIAKARELRGFNTEPGVVKGKFLFFSPEQARGEEVDARTDVWATGIVLYEMLCGKLPVDGPQYVALSKIVNGEFPSPRQWNPDIPAELDAIVMRALATDREKRFESCHAVETALADFLNFIAPRFSASSLSHLVQALFQQDLADEGRSVQVPQTFLEQLSSWRGDALPTVLQTAPVMPTPVPAKSGVPVRPTTASAASPAMSPRSALLWGIGAGVGFSFLLLCIAFVALKPLSGASDQAATLEPKPLGSASSNAPSSERVSPPASPPPVAPAEMTQAPQPEGQSPSTNAVITTKAPSTESPATKTPSALSVEAQAQSPSPEEKPSQVPRSSQAVASTSSSAKAAPTARGEAKAQSASPPPTPAPPTPVAKATEASTLRAEANKAYTAKNFLRATELGDKCIRSTPPEPDCYVVSGASYAGLNQLRHAVDRYRTFLRIAPDHKLANQVTQALKALDLRIASEDALVFYNAKKYEQALASAKQCIALNEKNAECHMIAGAAYSYIGQVDKTAVHYRLFLELAPQHKYAATVRRKLEQYDKAQSASNRS
ncbi:MAG TPA: protein kinase, partial [Myxococcaceae bacterium]